MRGIKRLRIEEGIFSSERLMQQCSLSEGDVSNRTIRRYLNRNGFKFLQARKKGLLSKKDKRQAVNVCALDETRLLEKRMGERNCFLFWMQLHSYISDILWTRMYGQRTQRGKWRQNRSYYGGYQLWTAGSNCRTLC